MEFLLCARLLRSNIDGSAGLVEALGPIVEQIRERWPDVEIWIRADLGFARDEITPWCETNGVEYVLGLARNSRLQAIRVVPAASRFDESRPSARVTWLCPFVTTPGQRIRAFMLCRRLAV